MDSLLDAVYKMMEAAGAESAVENYVLISGEGDLRPTDQSPESDSCRCQSESHIRRTLFQN